MKCRFCQSPLKHVFINLESSPAANSFLSESNLADPEQVYPLIVYTCEKCFLVQLPELKTHESIFNKEYVYFSSYSSSWLKHAENYSNMMIERFGLNENSQVVEIASNDGYLLQYFLRKNIPVLGIEPSVNTAEVASSKGIKSINEFFGKRLAEQLVEQNSKADLIVGNNVLAHVPDIIDFVGGMKTLLKEKGIITMEFPHLMKLIEFNEFDTIYHEHFSYFSFYTAKQIFESQGLELFDVEQLDTHGGSLRIYAKHCDDHSKSISENVQLLLKIEIEKGVTNMDYYDQFQLQALAVKKAFADFIKQKKTEGKTIAAYGAAAKGNTLLNFCGITNSDIDFVVDANPYKQNKWLPASHIPVVSEEMLSTTKPDFVIILPWNLKKEISQNLRYVQGWGGKLVTAIPMLEILEAVGTIL